jgi:hypothetical protein
MPKNAEKCRKMLKNAEKCRKMLKNAEKHQLRSSKQRRLKLIPYLNQQIAAKNKN